MKREKGKGKKREYSGIISLLLVGLLLAAALVFYWDSLEDIVSGIQALSFGEIVVCCLLAGGFFFMEGAVMQGVVRLSGSVYPLWESIEVAYCCELYRLITLGSGAGIAQIYYLSKKDIPPAQGTGVSMIQFVLKKIAVMLLGVSGFLFLLGFGRMGEICNSYGRYMVLGVLITFVIVAVMLSVAASSKVLQFVGWLCDKLSEKFPSLQKTMQKGQEQAKLLNDTGKVVFRKKGGFLLVLLKSMGMLLMVYLIPAYMFRGQEFPDFFLNVCLMAVTYMLAGVIPAPSGIGSLEFVFLLLFGFFLPESVTVPAILVFRFVTWIVPFGVGGFIVLLQRMKEVVYNKPKENQWREESKDGKDYNSK